MSMRLVSRLTAQQTPKEVLVEHIKDFTQEYLLNPSEETEASILSASMLFTTKVIDEKQGFDTPEKIIADHMEETQKEQIDNLLRGSFGAN